MNLHRMLLRRAAEDRPVRVGMIGAGKFGSMYIAQALHTSGVHLAAVADLAPDRARESFSGSGWPAERYSANSLESALKDGTTWITDDTPGMLTADGIDIVIEATGLPQAAIPHALAAFEHGKHLVNVTVESDVLVGPLLARKAEAAGVVYSLAYGDQPAEICELVDWARTCGFPIVCAGRGVKYLPEYHQSTPETVWDGWGLTPEQAAAGGMNAKMFNSFHDGTKPAIECGAVANACGLRPPADGLQFPPCGVDDLPHLLRPIEDGGVLEGRGMVETVSSLERDGRTVYRDIRAGVFVVIEAPSDYTARCFSEYHTVTDASGRYTALYRPVHLIGLELGVSIASAALRGEPTGCPEGFYADVVTTSKKDLKAGEMLDGEGGSTVFGTLLPAARSLDLRALPLGLAHGIKLTRDIAQGEIVRWDDVVVDESDTAVKIRREMQRTFAPSSPP